MNETGMRPKQHTLDADEASYEPESETEHTWEQWDAEELSHMRGSADGAHPQPQPI